MRTNIPANPGAISSHHVSWSYGRQPDQSRTATTAASKATCDEGIRFIPYFFFPANSTASLIAAIVLSGRAIPLPAI